MAKFDQQFDCFAKSETTPAEFWNYLHPKKITKIDKNARKLVVYDVKLGWL